MRVLVVFALGCALGCTEVTVVQPAKPAAAAPLTQGAKQAAVDYLEAVHTQQYIKAYGLVATHQKRHFSLSEFVDLMSGRRRPGEYPDARTHKFLRSMENMRVRSYMRTILGVERHADGEIAVKIWGPTQDSEPEVEGGEVNMALISWHPFQDIIEERPGQWRVELHPITIENFAVIEATNVLASGDHDYARELLTDVFFAMSDERQEFYESPEIIISTIESADNSHRSGWVRAWDVGEPDYVNWQGDVITFPEPVTPDSTAAAASQWEIDVAFDEIDW